MRAHLTALRDYLVAAGYQGDLVEVPLTLQPPFFVLTPAAMPMDEIPISGFTETLDVLVRVTTTAQTVALAMEFADQVRERLSPHHGWARIPMEGRQMETHWESHDVTDVERAVTGTPTNLHLAFSKHTYRLISQPL